jgi:RNA polymerase sigma-70 factor (ECF subfamily)
MNAVRQRETDVPRPTLVLVSTDGQAVRPARPTGPTADDETIRELWLIHGASLIRFALKLTLGDRQRAEDIVQQTLLRAWRHPEVANADPQSIRPWLFTVTRHVAIDMWRSRSRNEEIIEDQQIDRPDPVERIEQAITALDVRAALARLTPEHRQVVVEMYYLGRSVAEIAQTLGIPEGTVKSRSYYGLRQLKRLLSAASCEPAQRAKTQARQQKSA